MMKVQESSPAYEALVQSVSTDNWTLVPLKDLGKWSGGGTPSKSKLDYWEGGTIPWVSPKDMKTDHIVDSEDHITKTAVEESTAKLIPAGSVLIVTRSGILRHTLPVAVTTVPVTVNQDLKALTPKEGVLPEYVAWALRCFAREILNTCSKQGTTVSSIETAALHRFEIPVAPIDQQKRIVAEIEKQFSRLDEAVANLKRVKANLKRYKSAVLKAAVEGRLVETEAERARREGRSYETGAQLLQRILETRRGQWQGKGKYKEPAAPDTTDLPELPEGWVWASPEQLSAGVPYSLAIGPFGSSLKVNDYATVGVPLVFVRNIRAAAFGDPNTVYISEEKAEELRAHRVEAGDLLVTKMGDPPGDVCIYPAHRPLAIITADCIKLRTARDLLLTQFFAYAIESDLVHKQILGITKGVAQLKVSLGRFGSIGFPLPPFTEQHRIVAEVDRRLSLLRETEAQVDANLQRAERLRQSILSQAFASK
ncbi:MAG: restriction endonuclease subunit S [Gammaproteobacteria bacterium]|nr:restriction endonuclease subunit S [Gammaproteobacteria bacterium]